MNKTVSKIFATVGVCIAVFVILVVVLVPIYWMVITAIRPEIDIYRRTFFPEGLTLDHFIEIFSNKPLRQFHIYITNSLIVSLSVMCIAVALGSLAAYSLVFIYYRGKDLASSFILFAYVFPGFVLMVPIYMIFSSLGLKNTYLGLILADLIGAVPFATWMLRGYFMGIPADLVDSAKVDGCSHISILFRIILPVAAPGVVTAAIFSFVSSWGSLLFPLLLIEGERLLTLPLGIMRFAFGEAYHWGPLMAAAIISAIPPTVLYGIVQKYLVKGLLAGAVKG
ncbi:MAG: carbohydrate ABC transporter permease [Candidatus Bathyarchaeia archaeon]